MNTKTTRIGVFGTSRSGKDYTIDGAVDILKKESIDFRHVSPIGMVHDELNGRRLKGMPEEEKKELVRNIRKNIDSISGSSNVFVDEHFCFPSTYGGKVLNDGYNDEKLPRRYCFDEMSQRDYEVVIEEEEIVKDDMVIYLDIPEEEILRRFRISEGCKQNNDITLDDIRCWKDYEKRNLTDICKKHSIPFALLHDPKVTFDDLAAITLCHSDVMRDIY